MADPRELGTVTPLDSNAYVLVTGIQTTEGEPLVGPVARGGCVVAGEAACKATCQLWALQNGTAAEQTQTMVADGSLDPNIALAEDAQACADTNLERAIERLGVDRARVLMVAVGATAAANRVVYVDEADNEIVHHPRGWWEITTANPTNAAYARRDDRLPNGEPIEMLGVRLGDSGVAVDEMRASDGTDVYGITHLTRTNMPGLGHEAEYDGVLQTFRRFVAGDSMSHYDVAPEDVTTHVVAAVGPEAWQKRYPNAAKLEQQLPGWADDGLIDNRTDPEWQPGDEVFDPATGERDELWPNYPEQVRRQVRDAAEALGVTDVRDDNVLDPGAPNGIVHSSANRVRVSQIDGEGSHYVGSKTDRDLYAVVFKLLPES